MDNVSTDTDVTMAEPVAPEDHENGTPPNDISNDKKGDIKVTQGIDVENNAYDATEEPIRNTIHTDNKT